MIQASQKTTTEITKEQNRNLSAIMVGAYSSVLVSRKTIDKDLEKILSLPFTQRKSELLKLSKKLRKEFIASGNIIKSGVINAYNQADNQTKYLIEQTIGREIKWRKFKKYKQIPMTKEFRITNRYLSDVAIIKRANVNATKITKIIERNAKIGNGYEKTSRDIDVALGYRDRKGRKFASKFYKEGFKTNKNGVNYQSYRIARQETRRMQGLRQKDVFDEALDKGIKVRLKMISRLIQTSRGQSYQMDGQMDGVPIGGGEFNKAYAGRFMYPDGNYYVFGTAPVQWSINDREYTVEVFDEPEAEPVHKSLRSYNLTK